MKVSGVMHGSPCLTAGRIASEVRTRSDAQLASTQVLTLVKSRLVKSVWLHLRLPETCV